VVQQLTEVPVYRDGERLGGQGFQEVLWHGATITFGTPFPRATLVTHVVEIDPAYLRHSLTKRPPRARAWPPSTAPAAGPPRATRPPPTGVRLVLRALVATSPRCSNWAIVAAESYRLTPSGPVRTGLVALSGCWPVSNVSQLGNGTVAYAHGPPPTPPTNRPQRTRTLPLHLVGEETLRLAHDEGAGVAPPLHMHVAGLPPFVEPPVAAALGPGARLAAAQEEQDECGRRLGAMHSAPEPTPRWGAMLGLPSEAAQREQRLAETLEIAHRQQAAEAAAVEAATEAVAQGERRAVEEARRATVKRAREATAHERRLVGAHPPKHIARAVGRLASLWGRPA
jgi:hypothetical protein